MQGDAPDEEYEDPHGECRGEITRLRMALEKFVDHYPTGINPSLDAAYVMARNVLAK